MGRRAGPGEQVGYHHVKGPGPDLLQHCAGIADPDPYPARPAAAPAQRQPLPDQFRQRGVRLDRHLAGTGPGRGHVPRQGQAARPEVQHAQWLAVRRRQVDQVPEPPHVLELEVPRVIEVDMGLRSAVHQQRPSPGAVRIDDKLGGARIGARPDGRPAAALLPVGHSDQYRRPCPEQRDRPGERPRGTPAAGTAGRPDSCWPYTPGETSLSWGPRAGTGR